MYIKTARGKCWHWMKDCQHYAYASMNSNALDKKTDRPKSDLCNECKAKERQIGRK